MLPEEPSSNFSTPQILEEEDDMDEKEFLAQRRRTHKNVIDSDDDYSGDENRVIEGHSEIMIITPLTQYAISDLQEHMWVLVRFSSCDLQPVKYFIGKVTKITSDPAGANVRCFEILKNFHLQDFFVILSMVSVGDSHSQSIRLHSIFLFYFLTIQEQKEEFPLLGHILEIQFLDELGRKV